jgi:sugar/nucleoside kinase (ribokinase family)
MNPTFILAGHLHRDYLLSEQSRPQLDIPGGNLLYAAAGLGVWESRVGLLGRVGEDYPHDWLRLFEKRGWDTRGIHITADALDLRYFQAILENQEVQRSNPMACFSRLGLPFPKSLLGYQPSMDNEDDRKSSNPASPRPDDIPSDYLNSHIVHLCPVDYVAGTRLTSAFRQASITTITLDPSLAYMTGKALHDVQILLGGLTAFLPSEEELRALFWGSTDDLWVMAEALGEFGCEFIVVKRGARGQMLYDSISKKKWEIPAYPARVVDVTGAGDSFCGGFLAGYQKSYDPLRAVLHGSVSASLTIEGCGALHALESLPGLAQARLDSLDGLVRKI